MNGGFDCYGDMFEFDLHEMRNASEDSRRDWFEWWVARSTFDCQSCEAEFTPNAATVEEGSEVLCPACVAGKGGGNRGQRSQ